MQLDINLILSALKKHGGIEMLLIFMGVLVASYIESRIYHRLYKKCADSYRELCKNFLFALHLPLQGLIWFLGVIAIGHTLNQQLNSQLIGKTIEPLSSVGVIFLLAWFFLRFAGQIEQQALSKNTTKRTKKGIEDRLDPTTIQALVQLLRITILVVTGLILLQIFGIPISGVLAFGGIGGVAVGFAAKDLLANFFGSIMIFLDKPFRIGDWVRSPDKAIEGTVEHIGWRLTRIRTFDKRPLYVPNAVFLTILVENPSRMKNRRIKTVVGVRYDDADKIAPMLNAVEEMLKQHEAIDTKQTLFVNLIEFGASSLNFLIYTFTKTTDWVTFQAVQQDVFLKVLEIINAHGAECAFPTSTLHIKSHQGGNTAIH